MDGETLRDEGMALVLSAEEEWCENAYTWILNTAPGVVFTSLDLTDALGMPPHRNAVGAVFGTMARRGVILRTRQTEKSSRTSRHAAVLPVWRRAGLEDDGEHGPRTRTAVSVGTLPENVQDALASIEKWADAEEGPSSASMLALAPNWGDLRTLLHHLKGTS